MLCWRKQPETEQRAAVLIVAESAWVCVFDCPAESMATKQ
jgi:hypothetical protein